MAGSRDPLIALRAVVQDRLPICSTLSDGTSNHLYVACFGGSLHSTKVKVGTGSGSARDSTAGMSKGGGLLSSAGELRN